METKDIILIAVTLLILAEVSYLLAKLPRTNIKAKDRAILVDTSVLMDGRITAVAATGFIGGTLVIPRSVVGELQFLADNSDAEKRARARRGLDVISELQKMPGIEVELLQDGSKADEGVDERLLSLAKSHHAAICTIDYNLNKVAVVEGIVVLNINELAQSLRMAHLPGERMLIELVQKGQDSRQGVGYLPDGTMVVVDQASSMIGQAIEVEVVRSLQTAAGKMMFARRTDSKTKPEAKSKSASPRQNQHKAQLTSLTKNQPKSSPKPRHHPNSANENRASVTNSNPQPRNNRQPKNRHFDRESAMIDLVDKQQ